MWFRISVQILVAGRLEHTKSNNKNLGTWDGNLKTEALHVQNNSYYNVVWAKWFNAKSEQTLEQ